MQSTLRAFLFEDYSINPRFVADLTPYLADVVISVAQHGGVRGLDLQLDRLLVDAFIFAQRYIGQRLVILDETADVVAEGTVMIPSIVERGNRISCIGPYQDLCFRQVYNDTASWIEAGTTSQQIKDMLTKECPAVSANQENIEETGTQNHPWQTAENAYPGDLIPRLAAMSDSEHREWYFYLKSPPLQGAILGRPVPYFKPQELETVHFWFGREDCPPDGLELSPSLLELANDVRIMYQDSAGTQRQTASAVDEDSKDRYWLREVWNVPVATVPASVAEQYRDMYLDRYKQPQQSLSFRLNGWIRSATGIRQSLWKVIQNFPCNIGIYDLMPEAAILGGIDRRQVFAVAAAQYSYASNTLTITPDLEEKVMENLLALWAGVG